MRQRDAIGIFSNRQLSDLRTIPPPTESCVTTNNTGDDAGIPRIKSPIAAGMVLLGIYIAMYLAVAGVIHVLTSPDAATAMAPEGSMAPASAASASNPTAAADDSPSHHNDEPATDGYPIRRPELRHAQID